MDLLIARYLGGTASADDCQQLEQWMEVSSDHANHFKELKAIWDLSNHLTPHTESSLNQALQQIKPSKKAHRFAIQMQRIAAVLFIPLLAGTLLLAWQLQQRKTQEATQLSTQTVFGSVSQLTLPDGTKVWLNSGSTLQYPERFISAERSVYLTGEAFFEVHSDADHPFVVETAHVKARATGTKFNVIAREGSSTVKVSLAEGKLEVLHDGGKQAHLTPDQSAIVNLSTNQLSIEESDAYRYYAWRDGKLVFRNDDFASILERLGYQYNARFEVKDPRVKALRFRATFENETLTNVLNLLKIASPFDWEEQKPVNMPDGSFKRRTIVIKPKS